MVLKDSVTGRRQILGKWVVGKWRSKELIWRILQHWIRKRTDQTDQHTATVPVPSVNISERPSIHRTRGSHLQLVAHSYESTCKRNLHFFKNVYVYINIVNILVKPWKQFKACCNQHGASPLPMWGGSWGRRRGNSCQAWRARLRKGHPGRSDTSPCPRHPSHRAGLDLLTK